MVSIVSADSYRKNFFAQLFLLIADTVGSGG